MIRQDLWDELSILIPMYGEWVEFDYPCTLDSVVNGKNLIVYNINADLTADTNVGTITLPCEINDEDDIYTLIDLITDLL